MTAARDQWERSHILRACPARTMQLALEDLKSERLELVSSGVPFDEYILIAGRDRWSAIERRFDVEGADA